MESKIIEFCEEYNINKETLFLIYKKLKDYAKLSYNQEELNYAEIEESIFDILKSDFDYYNSICPDIILCFLNDSIFKDDFKDFANLFKKTYLKLPKYQNQRIIERINYLLKTND